MCQMSTAGGRREQPEAANCLIIAGFTGGGRLAILWYSYCTYQVSVRMYQNRNILVVQNVYSGEDTKHCPGDWVLSPRLLEGLLNGE